MSRLCCEREPQVRGETPAGSHRVEKEDQVIEK